MKPKKFKLSFSCFGFKCAIFSCNYAIYSYVKLCNSSHSIQTKNEKWIYGSFFVLRL